MLDVDASKFGLGAYLMQCGRPTAFASKTLTQAEIAYAQVVKELYTILFVYWRFHQFT